MSRAVICCWPSPAQSLVYRPVGTHGHNCYSFQEKCVLKWGLRFDEGGVGPVIALRRALICRYLLPALFLFKDLLLNCCWPSPAQWFLVPSPTGLMTHTCILLSDGCESLESQRTLLRKESLLVLRTTRNIQIHFLSRMQSFSVLKQVVYVVTTGP
jgi:hypothetical protein